MALGDGLGNANKNAQDLNKNLSATEQSLNNANQTAADLTDQTRSLTEELKDQLGIRSRTNETERALLGVSKDITKSAQENKVALGQQGTINKQLVKEQNQLLAAQREQLITQTSLSGDVENQVEQAQKIASLNKERLNQQKEIESIEASLNEALRNGNELQASLGAKELQDARDLQSSLDNQLDTVLEGATAEVQRLAIANQLTSAAQDNIEKSKEELATQNKINDAMGVAGGILDGLNAIAGKFAGAFKLDKVAQDMRDFTEEAIRGGKEVSRLQTLGVGLKSVFGNLATTLTDPTVVFGAIMHGFNEVEKEQQNFRRLTGQNADAFRGINGSLTTTSEYLKGMVTLTKELGVNANVAFDSKTVTTVTELVEEMGMAGKEAAQLAKLSKLSGTNLKDNLKSVEGQFKSFVKTNGVALNFGDVLNDIGDVSAETAISLGNNPQKIGQAAMEAKKLGLTLQQVDNIASSLLDFETSIQAELEAELLTGKSLNLEKARELALANDLEGVAKEIGNNQAILSAFATGNRKEQEATAKAMGMSRNDMAKMIMDQKIAGGLSAEQAAAAADISLEEAKRLTTQQQITTAIEKMSQAFAPILSVIASLISNSFVLYTTMGVLALAYIPKLVSGMGSFVGSVKEGAKGVKDIAKGLAQAAAGKGTGKLKDAVTGGTGKAAEATSKAAKAGSAAKPGMGKQIQGLLTGLGNGLKQMAGGKVLQGALNLIPAALGFVAMTAGALGLAAVALAGNAAGVGLQGLSTGLTVFANAMAAPTPLGPVGLVAPVALALLGAAMIPLAYALSLLAPPLEAVGSIVSAVFTGIGVIITSVAEGFTMFLGAITFEKAAALPLVGLGLVALAGGVMAMALATPFLPLAALGIWGLSWALEPLAESMAALGPNLQMISTGLVSLTGIAPTLFAVAGGLAAISAGLASMAFAGFAALPIIGALTALGTVSEGLGSIFGGGDGGSESKDDGSLKKVEEKLDQLISIVSAGGDVFIDGSKVGKTLQLASSKMG